jgi:hypothetical protein
MRVDSIIKQLKDYPEDLDISIIANGSYCTVLKETNNRIGDWKWTKLLKTK